MVWIKKSELPKMNTVDDLSPLLRVMKDENLTEFRYVTPLYKFLLKMVDYLKKALIYGHTRRISS